MKTGKALFFVLAITAVFGIRTANAVPVDLTTWTQEGVPYAGNWQVASDGSSVLQTKNGAPTYFVSDDTYINRRFEGKFEVQTWYDDDFIGFVFGWNSLAEFYLFDWKQSDQGAAKEGFTLSKISGSSVDFWAHTGADITVLNTSYSNTNGWTDNTEYNFTLNYTESELIIDINGSRIFTESGTFSAGKFGFYNYSQSDVFYQGFEEDVAPPIEPVPEPASMLLLGSGLLGLGVIGKKRKFLK